MITLDTSAVFARLNRSDPDHVRIRREMAQEPEPWIVPAAVLGELGQLISVRGTSASLAELLSDIEEGTYVL